jgi:hypothetical protein
MKRHLISQLIRNVQVTTTMRNHLITFSMSPIQKNNEIKIASIGEDI